MQFKLYLLIYNTTSAIALFKSAHFLTSILIVEVYLGRMDGCRTKKLPGLNFLPLYLLPVTGTERARHNGMLLALPKNTVPLELNAVRTHKNEEAVSRRLGFR